MSIYLDLFPVRQYNKVACDEEIWVPTRLRFGADYEFFGQINGTFEEFEGEPIVEPTELPLGAKVSFPTIEGEQITDEDGFGNKLTFLRAVDFKNLEAPSSVWRQAIIDFIRSLPGDMKIILYWR